MRFFLFLCVLGVIAYELLPAPSQPQEGKVAVAASDTHSQNDRALRSWGSTLQSLGREADAEPAPPEPSSDGTSPQSAPKASNAAVANPSLIPAAAEAPAAMTEASNDAVGWAKIVLPAKGHREPSVSSAITKFYPSGTELQVTARQSGWVQLLDPSTGERGWVFDQYLVSIDSPSQVKTAAKPAAAQVPVKTSTAKTRAQRPTLQTASSQPADETAGNSVAADGDRRLDRLARREARRDRGFFWLFRGRDPVAWSLGPGQ
jgi:SH3 domain-containing protein